MRKAKQQGIGVMPEHARSVLLLLVLFLTAALLSGPPFLHARDDQPENAGGRIVASVPGQGTCIIDDITARQAMHLALQRARAAAIETAAGVEISAGSVVRDAVLAADFIKSFARGYIVDERVEWLPLRQHQESPGSAPIPEYRVNITADVFVPEEHADFALEAALNKPFFVHGEAMTVTARVKSEHPVAIALFNLQADDQVVMLYPNPFDKPADVSNARAFVYPLESSQIQFNVETLPDQDQTSEAILVVAAEAAHIDFSKYFSPFKPMAFTQFFKTYARIAPQCQDMMLPYLVMQP